MKRTIEIVLGIIGSFFNIIAIALMGLMMVLMNGLQNNKQAQDEMFAEFEKQFSEDPQLQDIDMQSFSDSMITIINGFGPFSWFIVVCFIISLIVGIIAIANVARAKDKRANFAGAMFIVAAVFSGIISITSIIYYIAAIICFVRKPKEEISDISDSTYSEASNL
ncbi:DUF4064 domain-containing protein [Rummeliibacillus pycnus]|uniref:DUF4064 domain-containing protein n=1 Tax=Rummeliibacillus pycnus TaxID=101070 RepID=UPI000C9B15A0|nr:DUF4064 domain-containing protein [Rummeliibacillus pycnus]